MTFLSTLFLVLFSSAAFAIPVLPEVNPYVRRFPVNKNVANPTDYEGIVKFSNCSGSLVSFKGMPKNKKAIVMTNGHCLSFLNPGQVTVNSPINRDFGVFDDQMTLHPLSATKVIYSTMTDTDLTFYETNMSYEEIENQYNVEAFVLDDVMTSIGQELHVISGYWEETTSCSVDAIVPRLKEIDWIWKNSIRYSRECKTRGGFSGSPVIAKNTRTVIGIHNTGNNGLLDCSNNNPCEINEAGEVVFSELRRRYGQQVHQSYSCLNENFEIDLAVSGCLLPKP
jgi:hypothetical protein